MPKSNADTTPRYTLPDTLGVLPDTVQSDWIPERGWLMLIPVRLPNETEAGVLLPESFTKKATSGLCVKCNGLMQDDIDLYLGRELFFPQHSEYQVKDSETEENFYIVAMTSIIMTRKPPPAKPKFAVSQGKRDGVAPVIATLQRSLEPKI